MILDEKFWLAVAFTTFVLILIKLVGKVLVNALNEKSKSIKDTIDNAQKARETAEKLLKDAKKYSEESKSYADKLIADANKEAQALAKKAQEEIDAEIATKTSAAIKRVEMEQEIAIKEVKKKIVQSALDSLSTSLKSDITDQEQEKLLSKASSDLEKIL